MMASITGLIAGRAFLADMSRLASTAFLLPCASMKTWNVPPSFKDIELPEKRKLPPLERVPFIPPGIKPPKSPKHLIDIRGPELIHNQLIYKQYGIIALSGGNLKHGHIEMIRFTINKHMDVKRTFAVWRIEPPWKPRTKKGIGKRMGGGKGPIDHYVTPIKAGRVIVEVGGCVELEEVKPYLQEVAYKLPVDSMVISQEMLEELKSEEEHLKESNINPFTYEHAVNNNLQGCDIWISPYDKQWHGQYI